VVPPEVVVTPAMLGAGDWETPFPRTLEARVATFGAVEAYGWFVIGALLLLLLLLLVVGVSGVVTVVIALREARARKRLEMLDAAQVHHEVRACAEPERQRTGSEGDRAW
jgi:hypothetical protein